MLPDVKRIAAMSSESTGLGSAGDESPLSRRRPRSSTETTSSFRAAKMDDSLCEVSIGVVPNNVRIFSSWPRKSQYSIHLITSCQTALPAAVLGSLDTGFSTAQTPPAATTDQNHSTLSEWESK